MQQVARSEVKNSKTTSSKIGYVVEDPSGFDCTVHIDGQDVSCTLTEHLHSWIQKDDVVIVQDLYGDGRNRIVTGKTGSRNTAPSIVFHDEGTGKNISGVDVIHDENGIGKMDTYGIVEG